MEPSISNFVQRVEAQSTTAPTNPSTVADPHADIISATEALIDTFRRPGPSSVVETSGPFLQGSIKSYSNFRAPNANPMCVIWYPFAPDRAATVLSSDGAGRYVFLTACTPERRLCDNYATGAITGAGLSIQANQRSTENDILQGSASFVRCLAMPPIRFSANSPLTYGIAPEQIMSYAATSFGSAVVNVPLSQGLVCLSGPPNDGRLRTLTQAGNIEAGGAAYCPVFRTAAFASETLGTTTREISLKISNHQFGRAIQGRVSGSFGVTIDPCLASLGEGGVVNVVLEIYYTDQSCTQLQLGQMQWLYLSSVHEPRTGKFTFSDFNLRNVIQYKFRLVEQGNLDNFIVTDANLELRVPGISEAVDSPMYVGYITGHAPDQVIGINTVQHFAVTPDTNLLINVKPVEHSTNNWALDRIRATWDAALKASPPLAYVMPIGDYGKYCAATIGRAGIIADLVRRIPVVGNFLTPFAYLGERLIAGLPPGTGQAGTTRGFAADQRTDCPNENANHLLTPPHSVAALFEDIGTPRTVRTATYLSPGDKSSVTGVGRAGDYPPWQPAPPYVPHESNPTLPSLARHLLSCSQATSAETAMAAATHVCFAFKDPSQSFFGRLPIVPAPRDQSIGSAMQALYDSTNFRVALGDIASAHFAQAADFRVAIIVLNRTYTASVSADNVALQAILQAETGVGTAGDKMTPAALRAILLQMSPADLAELNVHELLRTTGRPMPPGMGVPARATETVNVDTILRNPNYTIDSRTARAELENKYTGGFGPHMTAFPILRTGQAPLLGYVLRLANTSVGRALSIVKDGHELNLTLVADTEMSTLRFAYHGTFTEPSAMVKAAAAAQLRILGTFVPRMDTQFVIICPPEITDLQGTSWSLAVQAAAIGGPFMAYSGSVDPNDGSASNLEEPETKAKLCRDIGMHLIIQHASFNATECLTSVMKNQSGLYMTRDPSASVLLIYRLRDLAMAALSYQSRLVQSLVSVDKPAPAAPEFPRVVQRPEAPIPATDVTRPLARQLGVSTVADLLALIERTIASPTLRNTQRQALQQQRDAMAQMRQTPGFDKRMAALAGQTMTMLVSLSKSTKKAQNQRLYNPFLMSQQGGVADASPPPVATTGPGPEATVSDTHLQGPPGPATSALGLDPEAEDPDLMF